MRHVERCSRPRCRWYIDTYMYLFAYKGDVYRDPASEACQKEDELDCGVFHSSELKYVFGKL
jgi:hypothetical protein